MGSMSPTPLKRLSMNYNKNEVILRQIDADMHNIREYLKILPRCKATRYNNIQASIKALIKEIRREKEQLTDNIYFKPKKKELALFEVEPSTVPCSFLDDMNSFFGMLEDQGFEDEVN